MGLGLFIFLPLWILKIRSFPVDSVENFNKISYSLLPVAIYQSLTHASGVIALGAGAVSFTQVVKASEPVIQIIKILKSNFIINNLRHLPLYSLLIF
jgi:solute carrier family 35 protein E1